ncbi:MAG TPA: hypothetical protein VHT27_04150 [Solirubrobacteraceae bacterium]|jgi:hypothetical protein|nr:hypothetical protein [Solirubrobacteraceae bacterium]
MSIATGHPGPRSAAAPESSALLIAGLWVLAVYNVALALWMAIAPHTFYRALGPFDAYNSHYIRDTSTFIGAFAVGSMVAIRVPSWRAPLLSLATVQFALHSVNHLVDIGNAHPAWIGYFDFFSLLAATVQLGWLTRVAAVEARSVPRTHQGAVP